MCVLYAAFLFWYSIFKANYLHAEPLGKRIISWYQFDILFGNLGKLVAEI